MHLHAPKPIHSWRELVTEVGVIVIGILIALGLEPAIENYHTHEQTEKSREAVELEIHHNLAMAESWAEAADCTNRQLEVLAAAVGEGDQDKIRRQIADLALPNALLWEDAAWTSALASGATDRFEDDKSQGYASANFLIARVQAYQAGYVEAWTRLDSLARSGMSNSPAIEGAELSAMSDLMVALLRQQTAIYTFHDTIGPQLGFEVTQADRDTTISATRNAPRVAACKAAAAALEAEG